MQRRLLWTPIGRYQMEVMSGQLHLAIPKGLVVPAFDDGGEEIPETIGVELSREETWELVRLVRSIRAMELETQPMSLLMRLQNNCKARLLLSVMCSWPAISSTSKGMKKKRR
ncbi:MAG TPA: hypothetical protein VGN34_24490 [Ktedonobacteraceae bacterium]|jgi:hypothetical protein